MLDTSKQPPICINISMKACEIIKESFESDINKIWKKNSDIINRRFTAGYATCTHACYLISQLSKQYKMIIADGEYKGEAHWFPVVSTPSGKKIVDLGNNIEFINNETINLMITDYPNPNYQVDEIYDPETWIQDIYPEIKNY